MGETIEIEAADGAAEAYLTGRAVNLHRYPDGAGKKGFWHKELPGHAPAWLGRWDNPEADPGETVTYLVVDEPAALVWAANFGALEWHPWTSRTDAPQLPTYALVDLDPGFYKTIGRFDARFPDGVPSLRDAQSLTVAGDWTFEGDVRVTGAARLDDTGEHHDADDLAEHWFAPFVDPARDTLVVLDGGQVVAVGAVVAAPTFRDVHGVHLDGRVHPDHRGRGIGMSLLADGLARIDTGGMPAFLESSNPANRPRYERLGFRPRGEFHLPEDGPVVTQMWREPQGVPEPPR